MKKDITTEEKIREAAKVVFHTKGFKGCTSREIAKAAGMNVALVNYYFRSKSKLFELIFAASMEDFMLSMVQVFGANLSLEEKIRIFIEREFEFLKAHPELPIFILNEMNRQEGCDLEEMQIFEKIASTGIFNECNKAQEEGKMRKMSILSITLLVMSNCQYPVMAKNLLQSIYKLSDDEYSEQLLLHKRFVTDMIIDYLFIKKN